MTWCVCAVWVSLAFAAQAAERLVLLDGSAVQDTVTAIDAQGMVRCQGRPEALDLMGLRRIERSPLPSPAPTPCDVYLSNGSVLRAQEVSFDGQTFAVRCAEADPLAIPLALVRGVRLQPPASSQPAGGSAFEASMAQVEAKLDELDPIDWSFPC